MLALGTQGLQDGNLPLGSHMHQGCCPGCIARAGAAAAAEALPTADQCLGDVRGGGGMLLIDTGGVLQQGHAGGKGSPSAVLPESFPG